MKRRPNPKQQGEVAELAFMHKVASLGFRVSKPYGDSSPYDFIVDVNRRLWKVQVKSSYRQSARGEYYITAQHRRCWRWSPYDPRDVDLIIVHLPPENCWYVIPVRAIAPRRFFRLWPHRPEKDSRYARFKEAWGLLQTQNSALRRRA